VSGWPLRALARIRDAEARTASNAAARARAQAFEEEAAARAIGIRAGELRREAGEESRARPGLPGGTCTSSELAAWSAARETADGEARRLSLESDRALVRARRAGERAWQAAKVARAAREGNRALERGAARWASAARAAREAALERDVEESWRPGNGP
jgi:hypothetical protein